MKIALFRVAMIALIMSIAGCGGGGGSRDGTNPNLGVPGATGNVTLVWQNPMSNVDGSPLLDMAGVKIYGGHSTNPAEMELLAEINNAGIDRFLIENLPSGTYYFATTAYNNSGAESDFSNVLQGTVH